MGRYPAAPAISSGAYRLWRTLGIMNRLIAVIWLVILLAALGTYLADRPDPSRLVGFIAVMVVFAVPSLLLWATAPGLCAANRPGCDRSSSSRCWPSCSSRSGSHSCRSS